MTVSQLLVNNALLVLEVLKQRFFNTRRAETSTCTSGGIEISN
jgi:hypothetical protein